MDNPFEWKDMEETFKCDRCGETFKLKDYTMLSNIQMTVSSIGCPQEYEFNLCPSCMEKLNDWLKGKQERQAKWIYDHESNSIECDKCRAEYKLSPYERVSDFDYCPNYGAKMEGIKE